MARLLTQTIITDEESGEVLVDRITSGSPNGKGFVLMYTDRVNELIVKCPSASTLKVFMLLSMGQQYDERGMITTKKAIQDKLGIDKSTCVAAFKWLKENMIINESKVNGCTEFMVNPAYVTIGRNRKAREREWVRRWQGGTIAVIPERPRVSGSRPKVKKLVATGRSIEEI